MGKVKNTHHEPSKFSSPLKVLLILVFLSVIIFAFYSYSQKQDSQGNLNINQSIENPGLFKVWALGSSPDAISIGNTGNFSFSVMITGGENEEPESPILIEIDNTGKEISELGFLKDNGQGEDLAEGDRIYTGTFELSGESEGIRKFQAKFNHGDDRYKSPVYNFIITNFPIGPEVSDENMLVYDPKTETSFYSNEIIISFKKEVSNERIREIASEANLRIVGTIPALKVYQTKFDSQGTTEEVKEKITTLESYTEVEYAELNYIFDIT